MTPRRWIGRWYLAVALLHLAGAIVIYGEHYAAMAGDGLVASVGDDYSVRAAAYWFIAFAPVLAVIGLLIDAFERRAIAVPVAATAILFVSLIIMVAVMPVTGAWLLFPPTIALSWRAVRPA